MLKSHIDRSDSIFQDDEGTWFFSRYEDVKCLLSDERFLRRPPQGAGYVHFDNGHTAFDETISYWPIFNDPPQHTRLREILASLFLPNQLKKIKNIITVITTDLLQVLLSYNTTDFMQTFASPLPVAVINQLLGTEIDNPTIRAWSMGVLGALDQGSPQDFSNASPIIRAMNSYISDIILNREYSSQTDWISELIRIKNVYHLSQPELNSLCIFLLLAGQETVHLSLGLGLMVLLRNPRQIQLLQENPSLVNSAVEEILRHQSPLKKICRWTRETIVINKVAIPQGQLIVGLLSEANRDPVRYKNPAEFDIMRSNNRHLTFGCGIHHCQGAM
ncbi:MAG: cytochrome P450 [Candidatus Berkiella sp.]